MSLTDINKTIYFSDFNFVNRKNAYFIIFLVRIAVKFRCLFVIKIPSRSNDSIKLLCIKT